MLFWAAVALVCLAIVGWGVLLLEWLGFFGEKVVANKWLVCELCPQRIKPGDWITIHENGGVSHLNCV